MNEEKLMLRLYVTHQSPNSTKALANIQKLLQEVVPNRYQLDVIDVLNEPALAEQDGIIASPTLVKRHPPPLRRIIGDLSDRDKVLEVLEMGVFVGSV